MCEFSHSSHTSRVPQVIGQEETVNRREVGRQSGDYKNRRQEKGQPYLSGLQESTKAYFEGLSSMPVCPSTPFFITDTRHGWSGFLRDAVSPGTPLQSLWGEGCRDRRLHATSALTIVKGYF